MFCNAMWFNPKSFNSQLLLGVALGVVLGFICASIGVDSPSVKVLLYVAGVFSTVFIALLKMIMIPLVFTSIVVGVAQLSAHQQMNRVWITTLLYFLMTVTIAVVMGITWMHLFNPGQGLELAMFQQATNNFDATGITLADFFTKFLAQLFVNPVTAMANGNIMAVVTFALLIGIALVAAGQERYQGFRSLLEDLFGLMMQIINWIMWLAPIGIMALLIKLVATQDAALFISLGRFMAVVIGATLFHGIVVLPLSVYFLTGHTPFYIWRHAKPALITAFATSSSTATMPVTLRCLEEDMKVPRPVAGFVVPIGAQLNMDGTALYEAAAALFIASLAGIELSLGQQVIVCLMAMIAAIGAPGIPSAGMVTMVMVLQSVGLPAEAIAILLPMDRLLDAFRTMVNVEGDICGSLVVQKFSGVQHLDEKVS